MTLRLLGEFLRRMAPLSSSAGLRWCNTLVFVSALATLGAERPENSPRIFIEPQNGFELYISAAMIKKHVPAVVTQTKEEAAFVLTSAVESKEESTGSKITRCLFLYCAGIQGNQTATVQLVNATTQEVAWAYNVKKGSASAYQSTAEAIAKHLKEFLEKHPEHPQFEPISPPVSQ
jgi:hypothetical protein